MKTYIKDFSANEDVTSFFLVPELPVIRKSKKDKDYLCMKLVDKTGEIDARMWEVPKGLDPKTISKKIVKVRGQVTEWNDQKQMSVSNIRAVSEADGVDMEDFFEASPYDINLMWKELVDIVKENVSDPTCELLYDIMSEHATKFKRAPAAKTVHHGYIGGLLEHTLSLCRTALVISKRYDLDINLMIAGAVLHDIGKIFELSYDMGTSYTVDGSLIGHIPIGLMLVNDAISKIKDFPEDLRRSILHIVASHHGRLEWGSPKTPLMKEAIAFHLCDMIDSQLGMCDRLIKNGVSEEGLTEWGKELGGPLYVPSRVE